MSKFKVGDRVNCYVGGGVLNGKILSRKATITNIYNESMIGIVLDEKNDCGQSICTSVHPKVCRKLVKKKRREFWMCRNGGFELFKVYHSQFISKELLAQYKTVIKVREVKDAAQELPKETKSK